MAIKTGDKLKTQADFESLMIDGLNKIDPALGNAAYDHTSKVHTIVRMFAKVMYDQQIDYHNLILAMGYGPDKAVWDPNTQTVKSPAESMSVNYQDGEVRMVKEPWVKVDCHGRHNFEEKFLFSSSYKKCRNCGHEEG